MSRVLYAKYWNDPKVTRFFVETSPGSDIGTIRDQIVRVLGGAGLAWRIISSRDLVEYWRTQIRRAFAPVYILAGVMLTVILLGMIDNLTASVAERTREIGMIRALGIGRHVIWIMFLGEALVVTVLGLVLALAQGLAMGELWVAATIPYLLGWVIGIHIPSGPIVAVAGVTLLTCLLAALVPAYRAAEVEPAKALKSE
jgi:putative ABC transport system permease protein